METKRGKLIVIEGIDGAGKSTQVEMLKNCLDPKQFHFTREATDGPIGQLLRYTYLPKKRIADERIINMLYAADRLDHITNSEDGMLKYINDGMNIISDRYYLSTMAYNSYMGKDQVEVDQLISRTIEMNQINMELLPPDLTIFIDLQPRKALERLDGRDDPRTIYETYDKLSGIYDAYHRSIERLRRGYGENIIIVNGDQSAESLHEVIFELVSNKVNKANY